MSGALNSFIVFSDDWGVHPSSCQHLFRQIARDHVVIWVNTIGMRAPKPSFADLGKVARKLSGMLRWRRGRLVGSVTESGVHVRQPIMLPYSRFAAVRLFNRCSVVSTVRRAIIDLGLSNPVVVATVPNACDYVSALDAKRIVYYCVDDFTQWPGLDHRLVRGMERDLIEKSDTLVATSQRLHEMLRHASKPLHMLSHGVDLAHFSRKTTGEHAALANVPRPRAGYVGLFDERSNQKLIADVASTMPQRSFVIAGPVSVGTRELRRLPNVYFTGPISYDELPEFINGLDALLIPYIVDEFSATVSPLKLKEYLATGKPVITTPIAEVMAHGDNVTVASTLEEWRTALTSTGTVDVEARKRAMTSTLATESWASKAAAFMEICGGRRVAADMKHERRAPR